MYKLRKRKKLMSEEHEPKSFVERLILRKFEIVKFLNALVKKFYRIIKEQRKLIRNLG